VDGEIPNTGQRLQLPNPQAKSTLPVAANNGEPDKISSIYFGLLDRGLQPDTTIVKFDLQIAAGDQSGDTAPQFNADGKKIQACAITDFWVNNDDGAQTWNTPDGKTAYPAYDKDNCVTGALSGTGAKQVWTFDLLKIAEQWGKDLSTNNGVMLLPEISKNPAPQDSSWQINLQLPDKTDYKATRDRVQATISFTVPSTDTGGTDTSGGDGSGGGDIVVDTGGGGGTFTGGGGFSTGDFGGGTTTTTTTETLGGGDTTTGGTTPLASVPPVHLPPVVWALIPLGLLALFAVRQVLVEPVGGPRSDGVIAAIRRRNAAMKGIQLDESDDVMSQAKAATRRARSLIRRSLRRR
jgi:hypothetical protein